MLELKNITKIYKTASLEQKALDDVSISFRKSEFAAILGQSGSGKTTLLNIIGGLDKYSFGDLVINGKSTKKYKDRDWDIYRNHRIGFVFQSYNLIAHQSVLQNVELALTISGVSRKKRKKLAIEALEKVGLKDHIYKKPTELSGGQMQRVAIARAIVNNPDIILADEPTGALDSKTSLVIMDILKEISKDKLVIMVTHNPDLANEYATRIINLKDGKVIDDSNPYKEIDEKKSSKESNKKERASMSFFTALSLSFNNLKSKKGRTFLTAFAGSIGIIGIALILSLSNGMQEYIDSMQRKTLAQYPVTVSKSSVDYTSVLDSSRKERDKEISANNGNNETQNNSIKSDDDITFVIKMSYDNLVKKNNLKEFKQYLDNNGSNINDYTTAIQYSYDLDLNIYTKTDDGDIIKVNPYIVGQDLENEESQDESLYPIMSNSSKWYNNSFAELLNSKEILNEQYNLLAGKMPENYNELLLVVDENNKISDSVLYALNIKDRDEYEEIKEKINNNEEVNIEETDYHYDYFIGKKYKLILSSDFYSKQNGKWIDKSDDSEFVENLYNNALDLEIVGIVSRKSNQTGQNSSFVGYTHDLTEYAINKANESEIVKEQLNNKEKNIINDTPFDVDNYVDNMSDEEVYSYIATNTTGASASFLATMSVSDLKKVIKSNLEQDNKSYEEVLQEIGYVDFSTPSSINIYPKNFEAKDGIKQAIENYNKDKNEENKISYSDYVEMLISSISDIINTISYVLIAFVAISLVVSSIMIAIITYISVLERQKEIGILRAMGASKRDIRNVFNAETFIECLISGILGIVITLILSIPVNIVTFNKLNVENICVLPVTGAIILIILSVVITVIAGLVPARKASKQDPVIALRVD